MEVITSLQNNRIKELNKLHEKKYRDETNLFLVETEHLVEEAYKTNQLSEVICLKDYEHKFEDIKVTYVSEEVMKKLSSLKSISKVIGVCKKFKVKKYGKRLMILDNIQDPGNLGTIIRSSIAFNFDTVIVSTNSVDIYNDKVIRATEGMIFHTNVMSADLNEIVNELKNNNYTIYTTDVHGGKIISDIDFDVKMAIIIGNEGNGVGDIKELADEKIYIPMNHSCESLNASVASSIIMYEVSKKDYE